MKCTNKKRTGLLCFCCIAAIFVSSCKKEQVVLEHPYSLYEAGTTDTTNSYFAENLCVTDKVDFGTDQVQSSVAEAAGVFNTTTKEVAYSQHLFDKMYPASTTKVLTAYIILKNCNLEDQVTVSREAVANMAGSSVCGIAEGDTLCVRDLLYGLMLVSGNDAANALAEYYSGSVEAFAEEMNREAKALGATGSHFVNANGLPDENHYTTVYDMYLIFQAAIQMPDFLTIISSPSYNVSYSGAAGDTVSKTWKNTNKYLNEEVKAPEGIQVVGGKTGTTNAAGYCLVLLSENQKGENIVSIVFKADGRSNLYLLMNEILETFAK